MKIDGHCHCGAITFEADVDPATVSICHCTDCQSLSGSAYRVSIPVKAADFKLLRGAPKNYVKTTAESGNKRIQAFCANCGSPIYACAIENTQLYALRVGTITQRAALPPGRQIWRRSVLDWVDDLSVVPAFDKGA